MNAPADGVDGLRDDPEALYARREDFYRAHGFGTRWAPFGFGTSELAFMRWEIDRGALAPGGSPYWRATNRSIARQSEHAADIHARGEGPVEAASSAWIAYFSRPSARTWYRAHTTSLIAAMIAHRAEAEQEPPAERRFISTALYRVLDAELLVLGGLAGRIGARFADSRLPLVRTAVAVRSLYPQKYPCSPSFSADTAPWRDVEWIARVLVENGSIADDLVRTYLVPLARHRVAADVLRVHFAQRVPMYP